MTWAVDTAGKRNLRLRFAAHIHGLPFAFVEQTTDHAISGSDPHSPPTSSATVWHYRCDEQANDDNLKDDTGTYDATQVHAPTAGDSLFESSVSSGYGSRTFDGANDYATVSSTSAMRTALKGNYRISGIFKATAPSGSTEYMLSHDAQTGTVAQQYALLLAYYSSTAVTLGWQNSGGTQTVALSATITAGTNYLWVYRLTDGSSSSLCDVDGELWDLDAGTRVATVSSSDVSRATDGDGSDAELTIAALRNHNSKVNGSLDDLRLDSGSFTSSDVDKYVARYRGRWQEQAGLAEIDIGSSRLDLKARRAIGGSLTMRLQDDASGTLKALFASRKRGDTYVSTTDIDVGDVGRAYQTIAVGDQSQLSPGANYASAETVWSTALENGSPDTMLGARRAMFGSIESVLPSGTSTESGTPVYGQPPSWTGRRVTLYAGYENDNGTYDDFPAFGVWRIERPPQHLGGDLWEVSCSEMSDWYGTAPVYDGLESVKFHPDDTTIDGSNDMKEGSKFFGGATYHAWVLIKTDRGPAIRKMTGVTGTTISYDNDNGPDLISPRMTTTTAGLEVLQGGQVLALPGPLFGVSAKQIIFARTDPVSATLEIMLSKLGDGANHATWDTLPGKRGTTWQEPAWQMGAGITAADVDIASFEAFRGTEGASWSVWIDEPTTLGEVLREFCYAVGAYWYVTSAGKLAVAKLRERVPPSTASESTTITSALMAAQATGEVEVDESQVFDTVKMHANWAPLKKRFMTSIQMTDHAIRRQFPEGRNTWEIETKFTRISDMGGLFWGDEPHLVQPMPDNAQPVFDRLRQVQKYNARARAIVRVPCTWQAALLRPGDLVSMTSSLHPNLEGGTISSDNGIVIGWRPDPREGTIDIVLRMVRAGYLLAPAIKIASATTTVLTLATDSTYDTSGGSPGDYFAVGDSIQVFDVADGTVHGNNTISSKTSTTLTVVGSTWASVAAGDICTLSSAPHTGSQNTNGFSPADYLWQDAGDGTGDNTRWS